MSELSPQYLTVKGVMTITGYGKTTVYEAAEAGELSGIKTGPGPRSTWRFTEDDVHAWMESRRVVHRRPGRRSRVA